MRGGHFLTQFCTVTHSLTLVGWVRSFVRSLVRVWVWVWVGERRVGCRNRRWLLPLTPTHSLTHSHSLTLPVGRTDGHMTHCVQCGKSPAPFRDVQRTENVHCLGRKSDNARFRRLYRGVQRMYAVFEENSTQSCAFHALFTPCISHTRTLKYSTSLSYAFCTLYSLPYTSILQPLTAGDS